MPHTSFYKGSHIFVILKDGTSFEDIFEDSKSGFMYLRERGRIAKKDVRSAGYRKLKEDGADTRN
jgi:hypothetical protein